MRQDPNEKQKQKQPTTESMNQVTQDKLGLDQDEQAMNGNYGMAQTKEEDQSEEMK